MTIRELFEQAVNVHVDGDLDANPKNGLQVNFYQGNKLIKKGLEVKSKDILYNNILSSFQGSDLPKGFAQWLQSQVPLIFQKMIDGGNEGDPFELAIVNSPNDDGTTNVDVTIQNGKGFRQQFNLKFDKMGNWIKGS